MPVRETVDDDDDKRYHNAPEVADLNEDQRSEVEKGAEAIAALKRTFDDWLAIGRGVAVLRAEAKRRGGRQTFKQLLDKHGYAVFLGKSKATTSKLLKIVEHEETVCKWRDTLTDDERFAWASPSAIVTHCPALKVHATPPETPAAETQVTPEKPPAETFEAKAAANAEQEAVDLENDNTLDAARTRYVELIAALAPEEITKELSHLRKLVVPKSNTKSKHRRKRR